VEIPGTPAGRQRCPWHTPEVIPTTILIPPDMQNEAAATTVYAVIYYVKIAQNVTATIDLLCLVVYAYYKTYM
jgi:hypothetical protein